MPAEPEELLHGAAAISVDLVGTVFGRDLCRRVDAYRLVHEHVNRSGHYFSEELALRRVEAEAAARTAAARAGRHPESVTVEEIYHQLGERLRLDQATIDALAEAEVEVELAILRPDRRGLRVLQEAAQRGTPVIAWYDTPLPPQRVAGWLPTTAVGPIAQVLFSTQGDLGAPGARWSVLAERYGAPHVVHVGPTSDAAAAAAHGITVVDQPNPVELYLDQLGPAAVLNGGAVRDRLVAHSVHLPNVHRSMVNAIVARRLVEDPVPTAAYALGYGAFGPALLAFVQWRHQTGEGADATLSALADEWPRFADSLTDPSGDRIDDELRHVIASLLRHLATPPNGTGWEGIQRGARDLVADHGRITPDLPTTVAVVDRSTAWENLLLAVRHPSAPAAQLLGLPASPEPAAQSGP